jgi:hypothetical protein
LRKICLLGRFFFWGVKKGRDTGLETGQGKNVLMLHECDMHVSSSSVYSCNSSVTCMYPPPQRTHVAWVWHACILLLSVLMLHACDMHVSSSSAYSCGIRAPLARAHANTQTNLLPHTHTHPHAPTHTHTLKVVVTAEWAKSNQMVTSSPSPFLTSCLPFPTAPYSSPPPHLSPSPCPNLSPSLSLSPAIPTLPDLLTYCMCM